MKLPEINDIISISRENTDIMQFKTPLDERSDLYVNHSKSHAASHPQRLTSPEERNVEVARVMDVAFHPVTRKKLPKHELPYNVLKSRRGHATYVESFTFKPTAPELLVQMDFFVQNLIRMIERHQITIEHSIVQIRDALHFAFGSVTPPNIQEKFFAQKRMESDRTSASSRVDAWKELIHLCQVFLDRVQPSMVFKEIKMNDDGHVVLRMTIQQADEFLEFRNTWQRLFSGSYQRYTEAEKITTLASVLGVVDLFSLPKSQRSAFIAELNGLFKTVTENMTYMDEYGNRKGKSYSFPMMEFSEASNRMLQKQDMLGLLMIRKGYVHRSDRLIVDKTRVNPEAVSAYLQKNLFQSKEDVVTDDECSLDQNHKVL